MAFVVLVIDSSNHSIADLNQKIQNATNPHEALAKAAEYINGINVGAIAADVQITTRSTDPSVGTAGTGSQQTTYSHK